MRSSRASPSRAESGYSAIVVVVIVVVRSISGGACISGWMDGWNDAKPSQDRREGEPSKVGMIPKKKASLVRGAERSKKELQAQCGICSPSECTCLCLCARSVDFPLGLNACPHSLVLDLVSKGTRQKLPLKGDPTDPCCFRGRLCKPFRT